MNSDDKIELITNGILIGAVLILIGIFIVYWIWPTEISRFIFSLLNN